MQTTKIEANFLKKFKNGPLQLQTYFVTTYDLLPILPTIVHVKMTDYLAQCNILYKYQSGFRTKHSTDLCLSYSNDKILKGFDNGLFTGMTLIDLQKAFDAIDHNILLEK